MTYLVWNGKYRVGKLYRKNGLYYFKYLKENIDEARKEGFTPLISFPDVNKTYENEHLFATFSSRLPEPSRPEIKEILASYGMEEYDEFELLKRSGACLPTDKYEFKRKEDDYGNSYAKTQRE